MCPRAPVVVVRFVFLTALNETNHKTNKCFLTDVQCSKRDRGKKCTYKSSMVKAEPDVFNFHNVTKSKLRTLTQSFNHSLVFHSFIYSLVYSLTRLFSVSRSLVLSLVLFLTLSFSFLLTGSLTSWFTLSFTRYLTCLFTLACFLYHPLVLSHSLTLSLNF